MKDMRRPVRCKVCKKALYYSQDPRHEKEVHVTVSESSHGPVLEDFYAHTRCWNTRSKLGQKHDIKPRDKV